MGLGCIVTLANLFGNVYSLGCRFQHFWRPSGLWNRLWSICWGILQFMERIFETDSQYVVLLHL